MNMPETYLSVVVTSRNDDHGGFLLRRMQTFLNAFVNQCKRHSLSAELIFVEWNPPPTRPPLAKALQWPDDLGPCHVRIIEVPPKIHQKYKHAASLPLYQMIGKNVGIRRASGRFVLATNIDILFNDELVDFIANGKLQPGKMYRIDRHDVMTDVPVDASVEEQLAYCRTHLLRLNAREGTFPLTPQGQRVTAALPSGDDLGISGPDSSVRFGAGWYPLEQHFGQVFRWADNVAEIVVQQPVNARQVLALELEAGPSAGHGPLVLRVTDSTGRIAGEATLKGRSVLQLALPGGGCTNFLLQAVGGGRPVPNDSRILNFRILRYQWMELPNPPAKAVEARPVRVSHRLSTRARSWLRMWRTSKHAKAPYRVGLPFSSILVNWLGLKIDGSGMSVILDPRSLTWRRSRAAPPAAEVACGGEVTVLHTNACGDFTLMAREHWNALRGYPEFDAYSFSIDSVFCYAAHYAGVREEWLREPMRAYHIEHGLGSGWTPEGEAKLFERLGAEGIPYVESPELAVWASQMRRLNCPMIFNGENWGLAEHDLRETVLPATRSGLS